MIRDKSYIKTTLRDKADDGRVGEGIWEVCNASILFFGRGGGKWGWGEGDRRKKKPMEEDKRKFDVVSLI